MPRIDDDRVIAPDLPLDAVWLNSEPTKVDDLLRNGPLLVEFWDFARVNSLRTLPYMEEWHRRYGPLGATIIGVHTPGYTLGGDDEVVREAIERLGVRRPVILDPAYKIWLDYGNQGWPARYLWGKGGWLRYWHYGEGDYLDCERAIQESLREHGHDGPLPEPMAALRPEDEPGVQLPAQTADIALPKENDRVAFEGEWRDGPDYIQAESDGRISARCEAGAAFAILSGRAIEPEGAHEVPIVDGVATLEVTDGVRVHGFQFTPVVP